MDTTQPALTEEESVFHGIYVGSGVPKTGLTAQEVRARLWCLPEILDVFCASVVAGMAPKSPERVSMASTQARLQVTTQGDRLETETQQDNPDLQAGEEKPEIVK
jgi:hypothetical protein